MNTINKYLLMIALLLTTSMGQANDEDSIKYYQVDLIAFTHSDETNSSEVPVNPPLLLQNKRSIALKYPITSELIPFYLRPSNESKLTRENHILSQQPQYQILFHYSWLQPLNNNRPVSLPVFDNYGWRIEGDMRVRARNYYFLDTQIYVTPSDDKNHPFILKHRQRLKEDTLYYLDNPQVGMLIKIHKLSDDKA